MIIVAPYWTGKWNLKGDPIQAVFVLTMKNYEMISPKYTSEDSKTILFNITNRLQWEIQRKCYDSQ